MIQSLKYKTDLLHAIFSRNRSKKHPREQRIHFPLIAAPYSPKPENPALRFNQDHSKLIMEGEEINFIGDMDMLAKIGIDILSQNIEEIMEDMNEESEILADRCVERGNPCSQKDIAKEVNERKEST